MKNFLQRGNILAVTMPRAVNPGDGVKVGIIFGVSAMTYASGVTGQVQTDGCFTMTKATGTTFAVGDPVYWDDTAHLVTSTASANTKIGAAIVAALAGDSGVAVRLNGTF